MAVSPITAAPAHKKFIRPEIEYTDSKFYPPTNNVNYLKKGSNLKFTSLFYYFWWQGHNPAFSKLRNKMRSSK